MWRSNGAKLAPSAVASASSVLARNNELDDDDWETEPDFVNEMSEELLQISEFRSFGVWRFFKTGQTSQRPAKDQPKTGETSQTSQTGERPAKDQRKTSERPAKPTSQTGERPAKEKPRGRWSGRTWKYFVIFLT